MIPHLIDISAPWAVLPPGVHDASLEEIEERFATTDHRKKLYEGLCEGARSLAGAGCRVLYVDGSFVTEKEIPGDFDACWEPQGVDHLRLDPVLLDFADRRRAQKARFGGEFFPSSFQADAAATFLEFFQVDRFTGKAKGILKVQI